VTEYAPSAESGPTSTSTSAENWAPGAVVSGHPRKTLPSAYAVASGRTAIAASTATGIIARRIIGGIR
jgi:hypothetical protein